MTSSPQDRDLHLKAVEFVLEAYDMADRMRKVSLDSVNKARPPTLIYHAQHELVRDFMTRAGAMLELAGQLGLIGPDEDAEIRRSISPELLQWLQHEDRRLSGEPRGRPQAR